MTYVCHNYRANTNRVQMPGACLTSGGQVIADLYDENGFYRSAVVADCRSEAAAKQYAAERNRNRRDTMSLKERLLAADLGLTEDDFDTHESDLYVLAKPGVRDWLKANYKSYSNVTSFKSQPGSSFDGQYAFDIPFANAEFWANKP